MREGNKFSIENDSGLWRKKVGAMLGVVASAALAISGCGAPISETAPTATTEGSTISPELDSTNQSKLDWQTVNRNCLDEPDCKRAISSVEKGCDGTTLLYTYIVPTKDQVASQQSLTVPSAPLHQHQKAAQHQLLRQHPLRQAKASPISHTAYPR